MNRALRIEIIKNFDTQGDFARAVGIDETLVSRVIRGRRELSPEQADKWEAILGCPRDILPIRAVPRG